MTHPDTSQADYAVGHGRRVGLMVAAIWMLFLVPVISEGWSRSALHGVLATLAVAAFAGAYLTMMALVRGPLGPPPGTPHRIAVKAGLVGAMALLTVAMCFAAGETGLNGIPYLAVTAVLTLPVRWSWIAGVGIALTGFVASAAHPGWDPQGGVLFGGCLATLAGWGIRRMTRVRAENTKLMMDRQRDRFARDLHDILGHSLTVITVKAELAQRLIDVDPERARVEIADLERLSRDALADVRRAVAGYREITLPGELANARGALEAAEIKALLPQSTESVPTKFRELFAWTVREGVTNVMRHSDATECEIVLEPHRVEVRDNGRGGSDIGDGHGLVGLRERAAAAGATVTTRSSSDGFILEVSA